MGCSSSGAPQRGAISRKQPSACVSFNRLPGAPRQLRNARGQKCFGGRKTKAGSGGGLTVRVSAEKGGNHFNLFLFFQTSRSRQSSQGRPGRSPRSIWRWLPGEEKDGARASLVRLKQLTRRFAQHSRPSLSKASFDLALKMGGLGSSAALQDPPRAG